MIEEDSYMNELSRKSESYSRWFRARQPKKIGNVVAQLMQRRGIAQIENSRQLEDAWYSVIGYSVIGNSVIGDFTKTTRVGAIRRGTLEVWVVSSLMMQELTFQKQRLLQDMQQAYPAGKIKKIRFRVGNIN
jgi:predicted nucleic acid-binding Zn ribbon protein